MKNQLILFCVCIIPLLGLSQQRPVYSQYVSNNFIINPALAGIENYWDIKLSYRNQWTGLNGAPVTAYMTAQGPLKNPDDPSETSTSPLPSETNPRGAGYWQEYSAPPAHTGLGITVINDRSGPLNNFSAYGSFSYHLPVSDRTELSFGVSLGLQEIYLNTTNLDFGDQNPVDPSVAGSGYLNKVKPVVNAGLWLNSANWFMGASVLQIVPEQIGFRNQSDTIGTLSGKLVPNIFIQAGYRFLIGDDVNFLPSVTLKYIQPLPLGFDINGIFQYHDFLWLGGSYRYENGFDAMLGINITSALSIGYSYGITTTPLNTVSYGTHEILIGFKLGNKSGDLSPRNLW